MSPAVIVGAIVVLTLFGVVIFWFLLTKPATRAETQRDMREREEDRR